MRFMSSFGIFIAWLAKLPAILGIAPFAYRHTFYFFHLEIALAQCMPALSFAQDIPQPPVRDFSALIAFERRLLPPVTRVSCYASERMSLLSFALHFVAFDCERNLAISPVNTFGVPHVVARLPRNLKL